MRNLGKKLKILNLILKSQELKKWSTINSNDEFFGFQRLSFLRDKRSNSENSAEGISCDTSQFMKEISSQKRKDLEISKTCNEIVSEERLKKLAQKYTGKVTLATELQSINSNYLYLITTKRIHSFKLSLL